MLLVFVCKIVGIMKRAGPVHCSCSNGDGLAVGPALRELHWLPLVHRIKFKLALLMYIAHNNRLCHVYISEVLAPVIALPRTGNNVLPAAATTQYQELELFVCYTTVSSGISEC